MSDENYRLIACGNQPVFLVFCEMGVFNWGFLCQSSLKHRIGHTRSIRLQQ